MKRKENKILIKERKFKAGYILKTEQFLDHENLIMTTAYIYDNEYIGNPKVAYRLIVKKGIIPQLIDKNHNVCSIGFNEKEQKWYGWSHRAIYGFKIDDKVKKGDCAAASLPIGFKAKNIKDAKRMAIVFAKSVS